MIEDLILIHFQLVAMGKINKKQKIKIIITRGLIGSPRMANCASSTFSKHSKVLIVVLTQHTTLVVVQTQCRTNTHSTLRWQQCKHDTGLTHSTLSWQQCKHTCIQYRTNTLNYKALAVVDRTNTHDILCWQQCRYNMEHAWHTGLAVM